MYWPDRLAKKIIDSGQYQPYWVDDMKTPSGKIHVGALRGVILHDLVYKALLDKGKKVIYSYVIDDHDPMDALPIYLDQKKYRQYMGMPLNQVPSPKSGYQSFAEYYAKDFIEVFNGLGAKPKIIWASELYTSGKMNEGIRKVLDAAPKIRKIYQKVSGSEKSNNWFPFQVICPKCGKLTTQVFAWDGEEVNFRCQPHLYEWAEGCGYEGRISPFDGHGKMPWKVEWAVKWQVIGVTIETAGKDHMSAGGSHDVSSAICDEVLHYPVPFAFPYEFFLIGGKKMSSSKGLGSSAREMFELLPPEILRFLMARPRYNQAIDFDPENWTIPNLFDEYDRCAEAFYKKGRKSEFSRVFELSQVKVPSKEESFFPRFRDVANQLQMPNINLVRHFEEVKGKSLTDFEKKILEERIHYAKIWLKDHAPSEAVFFISKTMPKTAKKLSAEQRAFLKELANLLEKWPRSTDELQTILYNLAKKQGIKSSKAFEAVYQVLIGKSHGPKAAWLIHSQDKNFILKRFKEAL